MAPIWESNENIWVGGGEGLFGLGIFECEVRGCTCMIGGIRDMSQNVKVPRPCGHAASGESMHIRHKGAKVSRCARGETGETG